MIINQKEIISISEIDLEKVTGGVKDYPELEEPKIYKDTATDESSDANDGSRYRF